MAVMLWLGLSGVPLLERRQRSFGVQIQTDALPVIHNRSPQTQSLCTAAEPNMPCGFKALPDFPHNRMRHGGASSHHG